MTRSSVENFWSHSAEKFRWGRLRCIGKFRLSKIFMHQRERGGITFLRRKLLSHRTEKLRWGTVRCFRNFRVSQIFMHTKGISLNSLKNFCHTVPIKFAGEHFCVSKEFWYRNFPSKGGGKLHGFVENFFISQDRKTFAREPFCVSENLW